MRQSNTQTVVENFFQSIEFYIFKWDIVVANIENKFINETCLFINIFVSKEFFPVEAFNCFTNFLQSWNFVTQANRYWGGGYSVFKFSFKYII